MVPVDFLGTQIRVGDVVVYPQRRSSSISLTLYVIEQIIPGESNVYRYREDQMFTFLAASFIDYGDKKGQLRHTKISRYEDMIVVHPDTDSQKARELHQAWLETLVTEDGGD